MFTLASQIHEVHVYFIINFRSNVILALLQHAKRVITNYFFIPCIAQNN